jgi:hypothetical protein
VTSQPAISKIFLSLEEEEEEEEIQKKKKIKLKENVVLTTKKFISCGNLKLDFEQSKIFNIVPQIS